MIKWIIVEKLKADNKAELQVAVKISRLVREGTMDIGEGTFSCSQDRNPPQMNNSTGIVDDAGTQDSPVKWEVYLFTYFKFRVRSENTTILSNIIRYDC